MTRIGLMFLCCCTAFSCGKGSNSDNKPDGSTQDTSVPDTSVPDTSVPDTAIADTGSTKASVETLADDSVVCRPAGAGPFPAVLYNHGGLAMSVGGNLLETCKALADAGYLARSEQRPVSENPTIMGHLDEVLNALTELRAHPDADTSHVGIMGYSRGGLLTLHTAIQRPEDVHAIILMAPAPGGGPTNLDDALADVSPIAAPVRLLVSENDGPPAQKEDHVEICELIKTTLEGAEKSAELTVYPPFGNDGHELFFEVDDIYWPDVLAFLAQHLSNE
jgi:dienelactone hydrolase